MIRQQLIFSKIKKITKTQHHSNFIYHMNRGNIIKQRYMISHYENSQNKKDIRHQVGMPNLKEKKVKKPKVKNIKPVKKSIYDCENESWTTTLKFNDRKD